VLAAVSTIYVGVEGCVPYGNSRAATRSILRRAAMRRGVVDGELDQRDTDKSGQSSAAAGSPAKERSTSAVTPFTRLTLLPSCWWC
jgi:hypothetical protein